MSWVKLDDGFFRNPKVVTVERDAKLLYLAGLCYASGALTDGRIPRGAVRIVAADAEVKNVDRLVRQLIDAGLWVDLGDAYAVHDYLHHNSSAREVHAKRDAARDRMNRNRSPDVRANIPRSSPEVREPDTDTDTEAICSDEHIARTAAAPPEPAMSRPVPKARPTRVPETFAVTDRLAEFAAAKGLSPPEIEAEAEKFRDHYQATGKTMVDWAAAWRNWVVRSIEFRTADRPANGAHPVRAPSQKDLARQSHERLRARIAAQEREEQSA